MSTAPSLQGVVQGPAPPSLRVPEARRPRLVSVVIPVREPGCWLDAQLHAVAAQDYPGPVEVVVADNGCRDGGLSAARRWAHPRIPLRVVDARARVGPGTARNAGVRASFGDFIAFCDADDVVEVSWLSKLVATAGQADVVGGSLETARLNSSKARASYGVTDPAAAHLSFLPVAAAANLGVWASVFEELGGFDEGSRTGEDVAFSWKAQLRGYRFAASDAVVHKRLPTSHLDGMRRFFFYGMGDAWLYREFRRAGMPRRSRRSALEMLRRLSSGGSSVSELAGRAPWWIVLALTCGRALGCVRYRVRFG